MDRAENEPRDEGLARLLEEDPADLYENAPCGYLSMVPDGRVVKVNGTFCAWTGRHPDDVRGRRLPDLLSAGGRVFYETHLAPLLRLQGAVREVALDVVRADGSVLPCLVNAVEVRDAEGQPVLVRATVFEATSRRRYERALLSAQRAAADSEARARTLQQVVSELAAAASAEQVADVVVRRARSAVEAGGAGLWLADPVPGKRVEGQPVPVTLAAADGLSAELLAELATAAPAGAELVRSGGVRAAPVGPELRQRWPGLAATMTEAGQEALVVVPVSAADDRHLGALVLVLGVTDDSELISLSEPGTRGALSPVDAELLATLGRQAGQALERVRLHEETVRQAARSAFLLDAARLLAAPREVGETVEHLAELAVQQLADVCVIDLVTERGLVAPVVAHADPARRHLVEQLRDEHLPRRDGSHPSVRAMVEHRTIWARGVDPALMELLSTSPAHLEVTRALELADLICVPLMVEGRPLGVISLGADARRGRFTEADVETAEQLALQMSQGMDVAQRFELESRTSHTLQGSLLPPDPPEVPGLALAVRYLPGSRGADVGGDFYDVVPLPGGTDVALAVGDVVGHDVTAAATMGQLRSVHRALLVDRPRPGALVERLHDSWPLLGLPRMATALFATLRPSTGELRIASAGHLPPLLVTGGRAELLPVSPGRVLGAPPGPAPEWSGRLPAGASLVLFTDGLVESRTADLDAGLDRLRAVAEEVAAEAEGPVDPDVLCDRLLAVLTGPRRADDVALLVLTRLPGTAGDGTGADDDVAVLDPAPGPAGPAVVPAPDPDLADALDGAGGDVTVSGDAMRWSPERAEPPAPAVGFTGLDVAAGLGMALGLDPASVRRLVSGALHRLSGVAGDVVGELRQLARDVRPGGDEDR